MLTGFRVIFINLYLRDTHILGIREVVMTHMAHGASMSASCYAGSRMWRCNSRKRTTSRRQRSVRVGPRTPLQSASTEYPAVAICVTGTSEVRCERSRKQEWCS